MKQGNGSCAKVTDKDRQVSPLKSRNQSDPYETRGAVGQFESYGEPNLPRQAVITMNLDFNPESLSTHDDNNMNKVIQGKHAREPSLSVPVSMLPSLE